MKQPQVARLELGEVNPSIDTLMRISAQPRHRVHDRRATSRQSCARALLEHGSVGSFRRGDARARHYRSDGWAWIVSDATAVTLGEVFVPGGLPRVTYNPRDALHLEQRVRNLPGRASQAAFPLRVRQTREDRAASHRAPTSRLDFRGLHETSNDFWGSLVDGLGVPTGEQAETSREETSSRGGGLASAYRASST